MIINTGRRGRAVAGPRWEDQQAMYIGLRYPEGHKKRKRRKQSRSKSADDGRSADPSSKQCEHDARCGYVRALSLFHYLTSATTVDAPACM